MLSVSRAAEPNPDGPLRSIARMLGREENMRRRQGWPLASSPLEWVGHRDGTTERLKNEALGLGWVGGLFGELPSRLVVPLLPGEASEMMTWLWLRLGGVEAVCPATGGGGERPR